MIEALYREAKVLSLPDGELCYVRRGNGPPVILLHGIPLSILTWRQNFAALAAGLDVIAIDLKGFGRSSKEAGAYSPEAHAEIVLQLMQAFKLSQAGFIASSYGCAVALTLAHMHPERVSRLVLINSVGYPGGRHSLERMLRIGLMRKVLRPVLRSPRFGKRILAYGLKRSYARPEMATPELTDSYIRLLHADCGEDSFLATLEAFDERRLSRILPYILHETLILWGEKDHILPATNAVRIKKDMQHARVEIIAGAGHLPHEEAAPQVNALISKFLRIPAANLDIDISKQARRSVAASI